MGDALNNQYQLRRDKFELPGNDNKEGKILRNNVFDKFKTFEKSPDPNLSEILTKKKILEQNPTTLLIMGIQLFHTTKWNPDDKNILKNFLKHSQQYF